MAYTQDEVIPAAVEDIPTSLFYRKQDKTMTLQEGVDGLDTVTYRETWIDGQWTATDEIDRVTQAGMVPTMEKVYGEGAPCLLYTSVEQDILKAVDGVGVAAILRRQQLDAEKRAVDQAVAVQDHEFHAQYSL